MLQEPVTTICNSTFTVDLAAAAAVAVTAVAHSVITPAVSCCFLKPSIVDCCHAGVQINPVAVYGILDTVQIPPGKYLLQSAAGSAFGRMLIALAKVRGVHTINVVRRSEQIPELLALG